MPERAIRIEGLRELDRAFRLYGRGMEKGLREAMEAAAEVVRPDAEALARSTLKTPKNVDWTLMRVGVLKRVSYVAPVERGRRTQRRPNSGRPKLKGLLLDRAMEPALEQNVSRVESEFDDALKDLARMWSRV